ncbi:hypothetical protein GCM10023080_098340 [Streptomyces pseudoechinosporeus]
MFVSRLIERARAALRGRRTPARYRRASTPPAPSRRLAPDVLGARLVNARSHAASPQAPQLQPHAQWFAPQSWEAPGAMVRLYVTHLGEVPRKARVGTTASPWGCA